MKLKLELILDDAGEFSVQMDNPGQVDLYTIIGLLEKVKTEILLATPGPNPAEEKDAG